MQGLGLESTANLGATGLEVEAYLAKKWVGSQEALPTTVSEQMNESSVGWPVEEERHTFSKGVLVGPVSP